MENQRGIAIIVPSVVVCGTVMVVVAIFVIYLFTNNREWGRQNTHKINKNKNKNPEGTFVNTVVFRIIYWTVWVKVWHYKVCQTTDSDYVLFLRCATHTFWWMCRPSHHVCHTSAFGECATLRISSIIRNEKWFGSKAENSRLHRFPKLSLHLWRTPNWRTQFQEYHDTVYAFGTMHASINVRCADFTPSKI